MTLLVVSGEKHSALLAQLAALTIAVQGNSELSNRVESIKKAVNEGQVSASESSGVYLVSFDDATWDSSIEILQSGQEGTLKMHSELERVSSAVSRAADLYLSDGLDSNVAAQLEIGQLYWVRAGGRVSYWIIDSVEGRKVMTWHADREGIKQKQAPVEFPNVKALKKAKFQPKLVA